MKDIETNKVSLCGTIVTDFYFSHEVFGEKFYMADLEVERLSGVSDIIPVTVSERLIDTDGLKGIVVSITGQFRSYNRHDENGSRLILSVFATEIAFPEEIELTSKSNCICLEGYVCKAPTYRETPLGREITDVLIAVNRPFGKSDYIPCICWGRNARFADTLNIGTKVKFTGRIQSRDYYKKLGEDEYELRTAYEVSVSKMGVDWYEKQDN